MKDLKDLRFRLVELEKEWYPHGTRPVMAAQLLGAAGIAYWAVSGAVWAISLGLACCLAIDAFRIVEATFLNKRIPKRLIIYVLIILLFGPSLGYVKAIALAAFVFVMAIYSFPLVMNMVERQS
jgi:hypothetical protein